MNLNYTYKNDSVCPFNVFCSNSTDKQFNATLVEQQKNWNESQESNLKLFDKKVQQMYQMPATEASFEEFWRNYGNFIMKLQTVMYCASCQNLTHSFNKSSINVTGLNKAMEVYKKVYEDFSQEMARLLIKVEHDTFYKVKESDLLIGFSKYQDSNWFLAYTGVNQSGKLELKQSDAGVDLGAIFEELEKAKFFKIKEPSEPLAPGKQLALYLTGGGIVIVAIMALIDQCTHKKHQKKEGGQLLSL